jgi:NTP pyrophosphatase (non-canonical NTP hydrolase)
MAGARRDIRYQLERKQAGNMEVKKTVEDLIEEVGQFIDERHWSPYHSPKNLSMSISIEAAELMELFQWCDLDEARKLGENGSARERIEEEVADIFIYTLSFARTMGIDLSSAVRSKLAKNRIKYPVESSKVLTDRLKP